MMYKRDPATSFEFVDNQRIGILVPPSFSRVSMTINKNVTKWKTFTGQYLQRSQEYQEVTGDSVAGLQHMHI